MAKAKVYFSKEISPERVVKMYEQLGIRLPGKVAVKVHSGEKGNQNFLRPDFWKPMVEKVNGTVVECNTAYGTKFNNGVRDYTESHRQLIEYHGWNKYFDVDLIWKSEDPGRDHFVERVETRNGRHTIEAAEELGFGSRDYEPGTVER